MRRAGGDEDESQGNDVSISDEKPLHMRRDGHERRRRAIHAVSISDEKPLHMRQDMAYQILLMESLFQSQTRSRSTCDYPFAFTDKAMMLFQSQTRSRSTCDLCIDLHGNDFNRCFNLRREAAPHATWA